MNPLLRSAIRELQVEHGIRLDPLDDMDILLRLKVLADAVIGVQRDNRSEAILRPVLRVGNSEFRRLSIGAIEFLNTEVAAWYPQTSDWTAMSYAFCHCHQHNPTMIWGYEGRKRAWEKAIKTWQRSISMTWADLVAAVLSFQKAVAELDALLAEILGPPKPDPDTKPKSESYGPIIDAMASQYSFTPPPGMTAAEYWIWRVPADEVELLVDSFLNRMEADDKKKRKPGTFATDPDKLYVRAHFAMRKYMDEIIAQKKGA